MRRGALAACCVAAVAATGAAGVVVVARSGGSTAPTTTTTTITAAAVAPPVDILNRDVTPQTQQATICAKGWTATIRPSQNYTSVLKVHQIVSYGYADRNPAHFEEDHVVSLELGGAPSAAANLFPEPHSLSTPDDAQENNLRAKVCAHRMTLADAQAAIYSLKLAHGYDRTKSVK